MLYVTTRNNTDSFTAQKALRENRGSDGGLYLPFRQPKFSPEEIHALSQKPFGHTVAEVLNLLFGTRLAGWDVDFCIGRYPVRLEQMHHRIAVAEMWHNPDWRYERLVNNLTGSLCSDSSIPGDWVKIAVRIAVLAGLCGEWKRSGMESVDIALVSGDFSAPISAWYARQWGLPIGNIICCCNENNSLWDLICHGQMRTDAVSIPTAIPEADITLPEDLERLVYGCGGTAEVQTFLEACRQGSGYYPNDMVLGKMRQGLYVSVVSSSRINSTIAGMYGTNGYLMSPHTALAYAGLLDYRSKTGETGYAVVLSEKSPVESCTAIAKALDIPEESIRNFL